MGFLDFFVKLDNELARQLIKSYIQKLQNLNPYEIVHFFIFFRILRIQNEFKSKVFSWMNWFFFFQFHENRKNLNWCFFDRWVIKFFANCIINWFFYPNIFANVYLVLIAIFYVCDNFSTWLNLQKSLMPIFCDIFI